MRASVTLEIEVEAESDIDGLEAQILLAGQQAMREVLVVACQLLEAIPPVCPHCAGRHGCFDGHDPRVVTACFGRVVVPRRRWRCRTCAKRSRPLDRVLAPLGAGRLTSALRQACVEAGASWPFATAARFLARHGGAEVSAETVRQSTLAAGRQRAQLQQAQALAIVTPTAETVRQERADSSCRTRRGSRRVTGPPPPARLVVEWDGGWVPSRDQAGGMEGKVGVVSTGRVPLGTDRARLWPRRYVGTFGAAAGLGQQTYAAACQLGGDQAAEQVVLGDGAEWIKTQAQLHFPTATTILDWAHVARVLHRAIRAARPGQRHRDQRRTLHHELPDLVWRGQLDQALAALDELRVAGERVEALEGAITYLDGQRDWLGDYAAWQQAGYPIGSGAVEREVAVVINGRMKGRGMRWKRRNADAVLAVRVDACNDAWDNEPPPPWLTTLSPP